jgi:hypothetical protein
MSFVQRGVAQFAGSSGSVADAHRIRQEAESERGTNNGYCLSKLPRFLYAMIQLHRIEGLKRG